MELKTATSYEFIKEWFEKAHRSASSQGKSDSAALWRDGLEHLECFRKERDEMLGLLIDVAGSDMAQREEDEGQKSPLLVRIRKAIKKANV